MIVVKVRFLPSFQLRFMQIASGWGWLLEARPKWARSIIKLGLDGLNLAISFQRLADVSLALFTIGLVFKRGVKFRVVYGFFADFVPMAHRKPSL